MALQLGHALKGAVEGYMVGDDWRTGKDKEKERRNAMKAVREFMQGTAGDPQSSGGQREGAAPASDTMGSSDGREAGPQERNLQRNPEGRAKTTPLKGQEPGGGLTLSTALQGDQGERRKKPAATGRGKAADASAPGSELPSIGAMTRSGDDAARVSARQGGDGRSTGKREQRKPSRTSFDIKDAGKRYQELMRRVAVTPELFKEMQPVLDAARQQTMAMHAQSFDGDIESEGGALKYAKHMAKGAAQLGAPMDAEGAKAIAEWRKKLDNEGYEEAIKAVHGGNLKRALEAFNKTGKERITEDMVVGFRPTVANVGGRPIKTHELIVRTEDGQTRRINGYQQLFNAQTIKEQDDMIRSGRESDALVTQRRASAGASTATARLRDEQRRGASMENEDALLERSRPDVLGVVEGEGGKPVYIYRDDNGLPIRSDGKAVSTDDLRGMRSLGEGGGEFDEARTQELRQYGGQIDERISAMQEEMQVTTDEVRRAEMEREILSLENQRKRIDQMLNGLIGVPSGRSSSSGGGAPTTEDLSTLLAD